ncbi:bacteriohemerythrin [Sulfurimonas marina]|uniref:Hemerythrin n=1 Tax=Sulfurimonas marina TaxID=2590551 RepID=A0A7M1AVN5_9BACT|nr:hemerythrin family protein [Sulfurimonas marina]QOP41480.1 hemerythrin [Sulfurimonas marina]
MIDLTLIPKVAYDEMNAVHAEEVELLNNIENLLENSAPPEQINVAVDLLLDHTREHFANEERLMQEINFPAFRMHKHEHDRVLTEFQYVILDWRNKKDNSILEEYLTSDIPAWLHQHISSMDTVTAQFIAMSKKDI